MSRRRIVRVGAPRREVPEGIDPRGDDVVLVYAGAGFVEGVPTRDLSGSDLARVAYIRRLRAARDEDAPRPAINAGEGDVSELVGELVATGIWSLAAAAPPTSRPTEPASPAEATEISA